MKHYAIGEINVTDPAWAKEYIAKVTPMVEKHGGRYLARTNNIDRLEGKRQNPHVIVIIEWPSKESALAFYNSDEYKPFLKSRLAGSMGEFILVAAEDMHKVAHLE